MKRRLFKLFLGVGGLVFLVHLVLASSYVQSRILKEIKTIVTPLGLYLNIESIDVSFFSPRIYLNKVSLKTSPEAMVQLPNPVSIERIKIAVSPTSLLFGQLNLSEIALYQPKIILENADLIYKKVQKLFDSKSKWKVKGSSFNVGIDRIGVVDAYVLVTTQEPKLGVDSGRFTLFVEKSAKDQFTVSSNFSNLTLDRGNFHTVIRSADFDCDITSRSIRANKVSFESDWVTLTLKGATSLPLHFDKGPDTFRAVYDARISLAALKEIDELKSKLPTQLAGFVSSSGNLEKNGRSYLGSGKLGIQDVVWDGYQIGTGGVGFTADGKKAVFQNLELRLNPGTLKSEKMSIEFSDRSPFQGELSLAGVELNALLKRFKIKHNPLFVGVNGQLKFHGFLEKPFAIQGDFSSELNKLVTVSHPAEPISPSNTVIAIDQAKLSSTFNAQGEQGSIKLQIQTLEGLMVALGSWGKGVPLNFEVEGKGLSLTKLGKIQEIGFGGVADLKAKVEFEKQQPVVFGNFELKNGEIADVVLGSVRGNVQYKEDLLAFETLELPSLEMIKSSGFVDFKPKETRYKFQISSKRASVDQVFQFFKKSKLGFTPPKGGELSAKVELEGGHDSKGIQVSASGSARGIQWFDEKWLGGNFAFVYRPEYVEISRATLTKPKGALGFRGYFKGDKSKLNLQSYGLKLEDLDHFHGAPLAGEIVGQVDLEGNLEHPTGKGELKIIKTLFRNQELGDSNVSIRETPEKTEFIGNLFGSSLQGRLVSVTNEKTPKSEVLVNLKNCNITPLLSMWSGKDLPAFGSIRATGDVELEGNLNQWETLNGSGTLSDVQLDLKTAPVRNQKPISFVIDKGAVKVPPFELSGQDSLVSGVIEFRPGGVIKGGLDAKLDLLYLQPFITGLEYGTGKVTAGMRVSGNLPDFDLLGNVALEEGSFRIQNLAEDFRNVRGQFSVTQDRISIDRFEATHGGGNLQIKGGVQIDRFNRFSPDLHLMARGIGFRQEKYLTLKLSGDLRLNGKGMPYLLSGDCQVDEGRLSDFNIPVSNETAVSPTLKFDLHCKADRGFIVDTDVMQAEWKGDFRLLGDNTKMGLLGTAESIKGAVFFKETKFNLVSGNIKFEDQEKINPRFNVSGKSFVKEQRAQVPIEYEVNLSAYGTPQDYKIRLSSVPALAEPDLIALLVLGVTTRGQDDNYLDFGSTLVGKSPLQSKLQNELGVNIKVNMQRSGVGSTTGTGSSPGGVGGSGSSTSELSVPTVKIQKDITNRTKLSYSSTLDQNAMKEFKVEQLLDENFTVNASAVDKLRGTTQNDSIKSYGLDFRYRFQFE